MADNKPTVPAPPWTLEALGPEKYEELHRAYYGGAPDWTYPYDLDLTPFYQPSQSRVVRDNKKAEE